MDEADVIVDYVHAKLGGKDYWQVSYDELQVLYACVRLKKPRLVVETGVGPGTTTTAILSALRGTNGKLISLDLGVKYGSEEETKPVGWVIPENLRKDWNLVLGDSKKNLENTLSSKGSLDIFFHDSEHEYNHVTFELNTALKHAGANPLFIVDNYDWTEAPADFARKNSFKLINVADDMCLIFP
ncbi:MAG: class I SAM-dependent methyltransferase [Thermoplasmataceae archaeon]